MTTEEASCSCSENTFPKREHSLKVPVSSIYSEGPRTNFFFIICVLGRQKENKRSEKSSGKDLPISIGTF